MRSRYILVDILTTALPVYISVINACTLVYKVARDFIRFLKFFACVLLNSLATTVTSAVSSPTAFSSNAAALAAALTKEFPAKAVAPAAAPTDASVVVPAGVAARLRDRCT